MTILSAAQALAAKVDATARAAAERMNVERFMSLSLVVRPCRAVGG
jgi:hypothetical protein